MIAIVIGAAAFAIILLLIAFYFKVFSRKNAKGNGKFVSYSKPPSFTSYVMLPTFVLILLFL